MIRVSRPAPLAQRFAGTRVGCLQGEAGSAARAASRAMCAGAKAVARAESWLDEVRVLDSARQAAFGATCGAAPAPPRRQSQELHGGELRRQLSRLEVIATSGAPADGAFTVLTVEACDRWRSLARRRSRLCRRRKAVTSKQHVRRIVITKSRPAGHSRGLTRRCWLPSFRATLPTQTSRHRRGEPEPMP